MKMHTIKRLVLTQFPFAKVAKHADAAAIKKAYRKLAVIHHPDKGTWLDFVS
jgi:DnaJ-domain-containing protein 1